MRDLDKGYGGGLSLRPPFRYRSRIWLVFEANTLLFISSLYNNLCPWSVGITTFHREEFGISFHHKDGTLKVVALHYFSLSDVRANFFDLHFSKMR